jgi:selenoprotein W-related protein
LNNIESGIASVKLIPSGGGRFEVTVNKRLVYSKLETGRHAESGEVLELVIREAG